MVTTLPYEIIQHIESKLGKDDADEFIKFYNDTAKSFEQKANDLALQKKLELKDELTKELATKADVLLVKAEVLLVKAELESKIDKVSIDLENKIDKVSIDLESKIDKVDMKLSMRLNFLIVLMIIALTLMNPVVAKIISNWLKLGL